MSCKSTDVQSEKKNFLRLKNRELHNNGLDLIAGMFQLIIVTQLSSLILGTLSLISIDGN